MFGFELISCIHMHVEPELSGVFVSVRKEGTRVVKAKLSCHQLLNGKPEFELCKHIIHNLRESLYVCVYFCV